jgi:hypothetical protein
MRDAKFHRAERLTYPEFLLESALQYMGDFGALVIFSATYMDIHKALVHI